MGTPLGSQSMRESVAIIHLGEGPPPIGFSIWGSPFVEEYKYLGVLLGISVPPERVFEGASRNSKTELHPLRPSRPTSPPRYF